MTVHTYSIVFQPPHYCIEYVKQLKKELSKKIGWFHSVNSLAHVTTVEFLADEFMLRMVVSYLHTFCRKTAPFTVHFDGFSTFSNGTFFLAPDPQSRHIMASVMRSFSAMFPVGSHDTANPHLSIARELNASQLDIAKALFKDTSPSVSFNANGFTLRKFNERRKQYDEVETFPFLGNDNDSQAPYVQQLGLF